MNLLMRISLGGWKEGTLSIGTMGYFAEIIITQHNLMHADISISVPSTMFALNIPQTEFNFNIPQSEFELNIPSMLLEVRK